MGIPTLNLKIRTEPAARVWRDGRQWYVAPAVSIVSDGVLCGSQGCLLYPKSEIAANVNDWNGIPLTMFHPLTKDGLHVSAKSPGILDNQGIGHISDTWLEDHLRHTLWFDANRVRNADARFGTDLEKRLQRGEPVELSTGLFTDNQPAAPGSVNANGKGYDAVASNYRPDHLAILPHGQKGACSLADGCGVFNANPEGHNQYSGSAGAAGQRAYKASAKADKTGLAKDHKAAAKAHRLAKAAYMEAGFDSNEGRKALADAAAKHDNLAGEHEEAAGYAANSDPDECEDGH
jgi:hypothetical protein